MTIASSDGWCVVPKIKYREIAFQPGTLALIKRCNAIIAEYTAQGFVLTLRQLYYQLVSRDVIRNKQTEYKRLGSIVNDARLAGLIDWTAIEDRTRDLRKLSEWTSPAEIVESCAAQYRTVAGPRHCPACGAAFGSQTATVNCSPEQLARFSSALKMEPADVLRLMHALYWAVRMSA